MPNRHDRLPTPSEHRPTSTYNRAMTSPGAEFGHALDRIIAEKRTIDDVKSQIVASLNLMLAGVGQRQIQLVLNACLQRMVMNDTIKAFALEVDVFPGQRIKHVDCLPVTAAPGDALIKTSVAATQGKDNLFEEQESYEGIIISSDGCGNGVVFQRTPSSEVLVRCRVQIRPTPDFTLIEIRHDI